MVGAPPRSPSAPCPARNLCTQLSGAYTPAQSCPAASAQEMQNVTPPTTVCGAGAPSVTLRSLLPPLLSDWVGGHEAGPSMLLLLCVVLGIPESRHILSCAEVSVALTSLGSKSVP